jgi:diguanylate cyclase (GGDEF)-like protein
MNHSIFEEIQDPYLHEVLDQAKRKSARQSFWIRSGILLLLGLWGMAVSTAALMVFLCFAALLAAGWLYSKLRVGASYRPWQSYALVLFDVFVMTVLLLHYPAQGQPLAVSLQGFMYFFVLVACSALLYSPLATAWAGLFGALLWGCGVLGVALDPQTGNAIMPAQMVFQQILLLLLASGTASLGLLLHQHFMYRQVLAEREFYEILVTERITRSDEHDTTIYADSLTGLGTRAAFERDSLQFTKVFTEGRLKDLTIAIIDIEGIETIAETRGPGDRDRMLLALADAMRRNFRSSDMAYRFSTDQFALLAPGSSIANAERLHNLLHNIVEQVHASGFTEIDAKMGLSTLHEVVSAVDNEPPPAALASQAETA